jgi:hypothetical protein
MIRARGTGIIAADCRDRRAVGQVNRPGRDFGFALKPRVMRDDASIVLNTRGRVCSRSLAETRISFGAS